MNKTDTIWQAFEKAIDKQFLSDYRLPYDDDNELSQRLSVFFRQAITPYTQALALLSRHPAFQTHRYKTAFEHSSVKITLSPDSEWFYLVINISCYGFAATVLGEKDRNVWCRSVKFCRRELAFAGDYDALLTQLLDEGLEVCQKLDNAITGTIKHLNGETA